MSAYRISSVGSIIQPPTGEVIVSDTAITRSLREKNVGCIAMGFADTLQREMTPDAHGIAYVEMNTSGRMDLKPGEDGVIATSALAGCTGVAGFASRKDCSLCDFYFTL